LNQAPRNIVRTLEIIKTNFSLGLMYLPILINPNFRGAIFAHKVMVKRDAQLVIVPPGQEYQPAPGEGFYPVNLEANAPRTTLT
jgi:hypothetical protein